MSAKIGTTVMMLKLYPVALHAYLFNLLWTDNFYLNGRSCINCYKILSVEGFYSEPSRGVP